MLGASVLSAATVRADPPAAPATLDSAGYVRLEVRLTLSGADGPMRFDNFCPKQGLWDIDLQSLLGGSRHVTLGVAISGPEIPQTVLTPVAIDTKRSGFLGLDRQCAVAVDQIIYNSPALAVKRHVREQFSVTPSFVRTLGVNPGLAQTINAALSVAAAVAGVPAETAAPFQTGIQTTLDAITVGHQETLARHLVIAPGPIPADGSPTWIASGLFPAADGHTQDLTLAARMVPVASLIDEPAPAADGTKSWTTTGILNSGFALPPPANNPAGTLRGYLESLDPTDLANYRKATTADTAEAACDALSGKIAAIGLSDRDGGLALWALTHDRPPLAPLTAYDVDRLSCLDDSWASAPPEIVAKRVTTPPLPPPPPLTPPSLRRMQAATQINDAFARFFLVSAWSDRRPIAASLFRYPARFGDPKGLMLPSAPALANPDQWLALHVAETPYAQKVGCYAYAPGAAGTPSTMVAIADLPAVNGAATQIVLTATFADDDGQDDALIAALEVSDSPGPDQVKLLRATYPGGQCQSGYAPQLLSTP